MAKAKEKLSLCTPWNGQNTRLLKSVSRCKRKETSFKTERPQRRAISETPRSLCLGSSETSRSSNFSGTKSMAMVSLYLTPPPPHSYCADLGPIFVSKNGTTVAKHVPEMPFQKVSSSGAFSNGRNVGPVEYTRKGNALKLTMTTSNRGQRRLHYQFSSITFLYIPRKIAQTQTQLIQSNN
jgi:hypothetical protein